MRRWHQLLLVRPAGDAKTNTLTRAHRHIRIDVVPTRPPSVRHVKQRFQTRHEIDAHLPDAARPEDEDKDKE